MESLSDIIKSGRSAFQNVYATSANVTAAVGDEVWVDSSGGAVTVSAPASPTAGDYFEVYREGAGNVTIGRNGATIKGAGEDFVIDRDGFGVRLRYVGSTWKVELRTLAT